MEADGLSRRDRMLQLLKDFPDVGEKHIEACITIYNKATADAE